MVHAVGFVWLAFVMVGAACCAEQPCPLAALRALREQVRAHLGEFVRPTRQDWLKVAKLVLSLLLFALVSQYLIQELYQQPLAHQQVAAPQPWTVHP